jgi:hypothetical protein
LALKTTSMRFFLLLAIVISGASQAQTITVMDFVKVKEGHKAEALFFYEQNWKLYRDSALKKGYIHSYRLEQVISDTAAFDLVLITEFRDSQQYINSEANFREIIATVRPAGPLLLNKLQPAEFRKNQFVTISKNQYRSYPAQVMDTNPGHLE